MWWKYSIPKIMDKNASHSLPMSAQNAIFAKRTVSIIRILAVPSHNH
ncbi:hypothetical protein ABVC70_09235 [Hoylesella timonensis]